jgi:B9 domain-containing protein 2
VTNVFYFSFPIDIQLVGKQKAVDDQWPILNFEVFEKDSWDRIYMQGCGFVHIPQTPGMHILEANTWKPNLDYRSKTF